MEYDLYISPDGLEYEFDGLGDRVIPTMTGQGMPPIEYITQRGPYQHGETVKDFRLRPRMIRIVHMRDTQSYDRTSFWAARAELLNIIRPNRGGPGRLRKIRTDGSIRDLMVVVGNGPSLDQAEKASITSWMIHDSVEFIAHDPVFLDPIPSFVQFTPSTNVDLVFPITFPITFGSANISSQVNVVYPGTWFAFPVITITGPIETPTVTNVTLGKKIELGYNVSAAEVVTVDLGYGIKTIINDSDTNLLGTLSDDSDLGDWCLECDPIAPEGINVISVTGGGVTASTRIRLDWNNRYIGI